MINYRISATMLNAYDRYKAGRLNEQDLICTFERRSLPATPNMRAGKAFHRYMETANKEGAIGELPVTVDGVTFHSESMVHDLELPATRKGDETEVKSVDDFGVHPRVQLSGIADVVTADGVIRDWKTTSRPGNLERYMQGWQWRVYMMLFSTAHTFEYVQVPITETIEDTWILHEASTLRLHRYADMHTDVYLQLHEIVGALDCWRESKRLDATKMQPR